MSAPRRRDRGPRPRTSEVVPELSRVTFGVPSGSPGADAIVVMSTLGGAIGWAIADNRQQAGHEPHAFLGSVLGGLAGTAAGVAVVMLQK